MTYVRPPDIQDLVRGYEDGEGDSELTQRARNIYGRIDNYQNHAAQRKHPDMLAEARRQREDMRQVIELILSRRHAPELEQYFNRKKTKK